MKNIKRITAAALTLMSIAAVTGCDDEAPVSGSSLGTTAPPQAVESTTVANMNEEDAAAVAEIDIGAEKLENPTVKFLSSWDLNPAEGQPVSVVLEMFQTQYGGRIELVSCTWDERFTKLATLISADDSPDMFSAADMDIFPKGVINRANISL